MRRTGIAALAVAGIVLGAPAGATAATKYTATLTGANVPAGEGKPGASGRASVKLNPRRGEICYRLNWSGFNKATEAGVFRGSSGSGGSGRVEFFDSSAGVSSPQRDCVTGLQSKAVKRIKKNPDRHHITVFTEKYEDGAIRGQIRKK